MLDPRHVMAFDAVFRLGTTVRAAESLHMSQPVVSRLLGALERATKLTLFQRLRGRLVPTAEGVAFHREVQRTFGGLERLLRVADDIRGFRAGEIRVACLMAFGFGLLPRVIAGFHARHPDVHVTLQVRTSQAVKDLVTGWQFDIGLAAAEIDPVGTEWSEFSRPRAVCVLPPAHRLGGCDRLGPADLADETFVSLGFEDLTRRQTDAAFEQLGLRRRIAVETHSAHAVCSLVLAGAGVGIVNPFAAEDYASRGLIVRPFEADIRFRTLLLRPTGAPPSRLVDRFVEALGAERDAALASHGTAGWDEERARPERLPDREGGRRTAGARRKARSVSIG